MKLFASCFMEEFLLREFEFGEERSDRRRNSPCGEVKQFPWLREPGFVVESPRASRADGTRATQQGSRDFSFLWLFGD